MYKRQLGNNKIVFERGIIDGTKNRGIYGIFIIDNKQQDVYKRQGDAIRKKKMTVYGVTNCGMESERVYRGLDGLTEAKGYLTIVIVKYS